MKISFVLTRMVFKLAKVRLKRYASFEFFFFFADVRTSVHFSLAHASTLVYPYTVCRVCVPKLSGFRGLRNLSFFVRERSIFSSYRAFVFWGPLRKGSAARSPLIFLVQKSGGGFPTTSPLTVIVSLVFRNFFLRALPSNKGYSFFSPLRLILSSSVDDA